MLNFAMCEIQFNMINKYLIIILLCSFNIFVGQYISIDSNRTPAELREVLTSGSCSIFSSELISSPNNVGYFNRNGSNFPFEEGVILRTGDINFSSGPYTDTNLSSTTGLNLTDSFLQNLSNSASGQNDLLRDLSFFEFDFTSISNFISFNFIFASNEYGIWQCGANDIIAIILTNLNTNTSVNLAVSPVTNQPICVYNVRDNQYNSTCSSSNPQLFGSYNVNNPLNSAINFRGQTVSLNASSLIQADVPYKIRFVIADWSENSFDSALFIQGNSFQTNINLGDDFSLCQGETATLNTGLDNTFQFEWFLNDVLLTGESNSDLTLNQPGVYRVVATRGSCIIEDTITISNLTVNQPIDLNACDNGTGEANFNLTLNNYTSLGINPAEYEIFYYASLSDFNANNPINTSQLGNYNSVGQTIYIGIRNINSQLFCTNPLSFLLSINPPFEAGQNNVLEICETGSQISFNLNDFRPQVINGNIGNFRVRFYNNEADAIAFINNLNPTNNPVVTLPATPGTYIYWARLFYANLPDCFDVVPVTIIINPRPNIETIGPIFVTCNQFEFPFINEGTFYSQPNGQGVNFSPSDITTLEGLYYIYNGPNEFGCFNQSSFEVFISETYSPPLTACGSYTVPVVPEEMGFFYTAPGGTNGSGVLIPAGTIFENNGTDDLIVNLYYYSEIDGVFCEEDLFEITISPSINGVNIAPVFACGTYTLPNLQPNQAYWSDPNGQGTQYFGGNPISSTITLYIYESNSFCSQNSVFQINILEPGQIFTPVRCGSYNLPTINVGNYYTLPNASGNIVDASQPVTSSQTIYHYKPSNQGDNCYTEDIYQITINEQPLVDTIDITSHCGPFRLPNLNNGTYFLLAGGPNVTGQQQLFPDMIIDLSGDNLISGQTYYIYSGPDSNNCTNQTSFNITILETPLISAVSDYEECYPYQLSFTNGTVYTQPGGPNGNGSIVTPDQIFNTTQTFYLYAISSSGCYFDLPFTRTYLGIDLPNYSNYNRCVDDNFVLPPLTHVPNTATKDYEIGYFFEPEGVNPIPDGFVFNQEGSFNIYVYAQNPSRFRDCDDERMFTVNIGSQPEIPSYSSFERQYCNTFTLPNLPVIPNATIAYYSQSGGITDHLINLTDYTFNQSGVYTIWLYAYSNFNPECNSEISFTFEIIDSPLMNLNDQIICIDPITNTPLENAILYSNINPNIYTIEWYLNNNLVFSGATYVTNVPGNYEVMAYVTDPSLHSQVYCDYVNGTVVVTISSRPIAEVIVSPPFLNPNSAIVNITGGYGVYEYSLDNGPFSSQHVFENLTTGYHSVIIKDVLNNCGEITLSFFIVDYPRFFTPNNDGFNDTWNINRYQSALGQASINIFDRFGKLIHIIKSENQGWDGKYNGIELPSSDYWFTIDYLNNENIKQTFKAHFSLKR